MIPFYKAPELRKGFIWRLLLPLKIFFLFNLFVLRKIV